MCNFHLFRNGSEQDAVSFDAASASAFASASADLEERARQLEKSYLRSPASVSRTQVENLAVETYRLTVQMFDAKISGGQYLTQDEKNVYDLCKREIAKTASVKNLRGILGFMFGAIEQVRDCIDEVKEWFGLTAAADKAGMLLIRAGDEVLPQYKSVISRVFSAIQDFFLPDIKPSIIYLAEAQALCALKYQEARTVDKNLASAMLDVADYAYSGHAVSASDEYVKLSSSDLPADIRVLYDETTGLLKSSRGLRVWLGKKDNRVIVAFSGTDPWSFDMVYADIIQLSSPSTLYLKAAGLLKILSEHMRGKNFYVTGHSLGGGLTQFALTACVDVAPNRLDGFAFNPVGLSMPSISNLQSSRLSKSAKKLWVFSTCKDPVSIFGGKIGCLTTLTKSGSDGHGMIDLKLCMKKYITAPIPIQTPDIAITVSSHSESDFIPYTKRLSFRDENGAVYPVFNPSSSSYKQQVQTVKINKKLFDELKFSQSATDECLGVVNKFNGTAHTVFNRLLLLSTGTPTLSTATPGNIHSSVLFGKFGLGVKEYIPFLRKVYADSGEYSAVSKSAFETMISHLDNPYAFDKAAWVEGIRLAFHIDVKSVFSRFPLAEGIFDEFLMKFSSDRLDLYRASCTGSKPTKAQIKDFATKLCALARDSTDYLIEQAAWASVITSSQMTQFRAEIRSLCDRVLAAY